jgi:hypothetical protein
LGKKLNILRIAASDGKQEGNPAGVWIGDVLPNERIPRKNTLTFSAIYRAHKAGEKI